MIAIVIPYFKFNFFEETLQSLANQTDKRFKVYIGNDASPVNPEELLSKFENIFDFEYKEFKNNLGGVSLVQQWERCLKIKKEEKWTLILGDDDVLDQNCISDFYKNLPEIIQSETNVVRYASLVIDGNGNEISKKYLHPVIEKSTDFLFRKYRGGTRSSLSEYVFKSNIIKQVKLKEFPLAWHSDVLAILEFSNFKSIYTINSSFVYFRNSDFNITNSATNLVLKNKASFQFYYYLLHSKKEHFRTAELNILYDRLEKTFLDNKKNAFFWRKVTSLYLSRLLLIRGSVFIYKFVLSVLKIRR